MKFTNAEKRFFKIALCGAIIGLVGAATMFMKVM